MHTTILYRLNMFERIFAYAFVCGIITGGIAAKEFIPCDRPSLDIGVEIVDDDSALQFKENEEITFRCEDEDKSLVGSPTTMCLKKGKWSMPPPTCQLITDCIVPPPTWRMSHQPSAISIATGESIQYVCDQGYMIVFGEDDVVPEGEGDEQDDSRRFTRKCMPDGRLDGPTPFCERFYCNRGETTIFKGRSYFTGNSTVSYPGETVRYRCDPDFLLIGDNIQYCEEDFGWSGRKPFCREMRCLKPRLWKGDVEPFGNATIKPGMTINMTCFDGYELFGPKQLTCMENNAWNSDAVPVCIPKFERDPCFDQGVPLNGWRHIKHKPETITVTYRCESGYRRIGKRKSTCPRGRGPWSEKLPICKSEYSFPRVQDEAKRLLTRMNELQTRRVANNYDRLSATVVYLLIDQSRSKMNDSIESTMNILRPIIEVMRQQVFDIKVAIIGFSTNATVLLEPSNNMTEIAEVMESIRNIRGGTNIAASFKVLRTFPVQEDVSHIALLVSDGIYNAGGNPNRHADELKEAGFKILLLSVSISTYNPDMMSLASNIETDVFHINQHDFVSNSFKLQLEGDYSVCGRTNNYYKNPWAVFVSDGEKKMTGAIIGDQHVIALDDLDLDENSTDITVQYGSALERQVEVEKVHVTTIGRGEKLVLLKLREKLQLSLAARPLCMTVLLDLESHNGFKPYARNELLYRRTNEGLVGGVREYETYASAVHVPVIITGNDTRHIVVEENWSAEDEEYEEDYPMFQEPRVSIEAGDFYVGTVPNKYDLRDDRMVLAGFRSRRDGKFIKMHEAGLFVYINTRKVEEYNEV